MQNRMGAYPMTAARLENTEVEGQVETCSQAWTAAAVEAVPACQMA